MRKHAHGWLFDKLESKVAEWQQGVAGNARCQGIGNAEALGQSAKDSP